MSEFYEDDGTPKACPCCGGTWFANNDRVVSEWGVMETEIFCVWCGDSVAYWAYGSYDPAYYAYLKDGNV